MNREQKTATVEAIARQIEAADAVFAVDYRGISVPQAAALRVRLREADATLRIVKNSLTERAAERAGADSLRALLEGPTALTFVRGDAALAAKALADFARAEVPMEFKGGLMGGEELSVEQIKSISRLPARDVLYAQMVGTVAAPLTGLARGLNGLLSGLAVQLRQIADKGLIGGDQAADAAPEETAEGEAATDAQEPEAAGADLLLGLLEGPSAIAFLDADGDPVAVAKALADAARTTRVLAVRGGILEGSPVTPEDVSNLATLPPADVLRAQLVGALAGSLTTVVGLFAAPMRDLVGVLQARIDQLEAQGGGAVEEERQADEPQTEEEPESEPAPEEAEPVEEGES